MRGYLWGRQGANSEGPLEHLGNDRAHNTFPMKLLFLCPENHKPFETDQFNIIEDKGIKTTETGQRVWDAKDFG
jgi:hypothetical protein